MLRLRSRRRACEHTPTTAASEDIARRLERFTKDERFRIENILKIHDARNRRIIPLRFNEAQVRLYALYRWFRDRRLPVRIIICKARRAGLSTGVEALIYDDTTTHPRTNSLIVANERNPAQNVIEMCRTFWQYTPVQALLGEQLVPVRPEIPAVYRNNPPRDRIEFDAPLHSKILIATARSIDAYLGYGFQNLHATEASRYRDAAETFRALYPTLVASDHSAMYIESTPNGQTGYGYWFYREVMAAHERRQTEYGDMRLLFIEWWRMRYSFSVPFRDEGRKRSFAHTLTQTERDLVKRFDVTLEQLQWRRMILAGPTFNNDEEIFMQEYPEDLATAFLTSGSCVFRRKDIRRYLASVREPIWEGDVYWGENEADLKKTSIHELVRRPRFRTRGEAIADGRKPHVYERDCYDNLKVWRWPNDGERLFIAADVATGQSRDGDYSAVGVGVMNENGQDQVIMTWKGHINPLHFGEVLAALAWGLRYRVGEDVVAPELAPEWTGPGHGTCTYIDEKNLYPRLFRHQAVGTHKLPTTKHIGFESNAHTVPAAMSYTCRSIERNLIDIPDRNVIEQMASYRQMDSFGDDASYGGAAGRHDDHVAWLRILCFLLRVRRSIVPGSADVMEKPEGLQDRDLPAWSPWEGRDTLPPMPGAEYRDLDDDDNEENLWYSG